MSEPRYKQVNFRVDDAKYDKLKALANADKRTLADYTRIIVEDYLSERYFPRNQKRSTKNAN